VEIVLYSCNETSVLSVEPILKGGRDSFSQVMGKVMMQRRRMPNRVFCSAS